MGSVPALSVFPPASAVSSSSSSSFDVDGDARYIVGALLGQGGMGRVSCAFDRRLQRDVAFKEITSPGPLTEALLQREATLTAELDHPGIVPVYDAGRTADGRLFYTMRLVRGHSLRDVARRTWRGGAPPLAERLALARHVVGAARAVAFAHGRGIVHRDLKPDNVLVGLLGEVQVADWGLARRVPLSSGSSSSSSAAAAASSLLSPAAGTPGYQAPEVVAGGDATPRSDVFSLGVMLGEVVTGPASSSAASAASAVPPALQAIVQRACAVDPAVRYDDATAFVTDLQAFFDHGLVSAHVEGPVERLGRLWRRHRAEGLVAVGAAALLCAVVVVGGGLSVARVVAERDRAIVAERQTRAALVVADLRLATSTVAEAERALALDRGRDAAALASDALALLGIHGPDHLAEQEALRARARGVLGALTPRVGAGLPTTTTVADLHAGCDAVVVDDRADGVMCRRAGRSVWRRVTRTGEVETPDSVEVEVDVAVAAMAADPRTPRHVLLRGLDDRLVLFDSETGAARPVGKAVAAETFLALDLHDGHDLDGRHGRFVSANRALVVVGDLAGGAPTVVRTCGRGLAPQVLQGALFHDGVLQLVCADGRGETIDDAGRVVPLWPTPPLDAAALAVLERATVVVADGPGRFLIGTLGSELARFEPRARPALTVLAERPDLGVIHHLVRVPGDDARWYVSGSSGAPAFFDVDGTFSGDFGVADRGPALRSRPSDDLIVVGAERTSLVHGPPSSPRAVTLPAGLASVAVSPTHDVVAAGADGLIARIDVARGRVAVVDTGLRMTVKQVAFDGQGRILSGGIDARGPVRWSVPTTGRAGPTVGDDLLPTLTLRRVGALDDGVIWGLGYEEGPWWWRDAAPVGAPLRLSDPLPIVHARFLDGGVVVERHGARAIVALTATGEVLLARPASTRAILQVPGASQVAAFSDDDDDNDDDNDNDNDNDNDDHTWRPDLVVVGRDGDVLVHDGGGRLIRRLSIGSDRVTDVGIADDGAVVVAGTLHGELWVWRMADGLLWQRVRLHTEQVGAIALHRARDGAIAVTSAGWDRRVAGLVVVEDEPPARGDDDDGRGRLPP